MTHPRPIVVALPLDHETREILHAATELAKRTEAPILPVHALGWRPMETDAGLIERMTADAEQIGAHLQAVYEAGVTVLDTVIARDRPEDLVIETAHASGAQLIVTGGGGPATVRRWVVGSVAERIVRHAMVPVWIARGEPPIDGRVLCPVDLSPQSRVGVTAAMRMARLFDAKLIVLSVIPEKGHGYLDKAELASRLDEDEPKALAQVEAFLAAQDFTGIDLEVRVTIGKPASRIVEASEDCNLLVIASRGFDLLKPGSLGSVTERALRYSRCAALTIRDLDEGRERRERSLLRIADLHRKAMVLLEAGEADKALPLLQMAAGRAPANAVLQEALAAALDGVGRDAEADSRRNLARIIRENFQ